MPPRNNYNNASNSNEYWTGGNNYSNNWNQWSNNNYKSSGNTLLRNLDPHRLAQSRFRFLIRDSLVRGSNSNEVSIVHNKTKTAGDGSGTIKSDGVIVKTFTVNEVRRNLESTLKNPDTLPDWDLIDSVDLLINDNRNFDKKPVSDDYNNGSKNSNSDNSSIDISSRCSICLCEELRAPRVLKCGHCFCYGCIARYLLRDPLNGKMNPYSKGHFLGTEVNETTLGTSAASTNSGGKGGSSGSSVTGTWGNSNSSSSGGGFNATAYQGSQAISSTNTVTSSVAAANQPIKWEKDPIRKCPVCKSECYLSDAKPVRFQRVQGNRKARRFLLMQNNTPVYTYYHKRYKNKQALTDGGYQVDSPSDDHLNEEEDYYATVDANDTIPSENSLGWYFSKVVRVTDGSADDRLKEDLKMLLQQVQLIRQDPLGFHGEAEDLPFLDLLINYLCCSILKFKNVEAFLREMSVEEEKRYALELKTDENYGKKKAAAEEVKAAARVAEKEKIENENRNFLDLRYELEIEPYLWREMEMIEEEKNEQNKVDKGGKGKDGKGKGKKGKGKKGKDNVIEENSESIEQNPDVDAAPSKNSVTGTSVKSSENGGEDDEWFTAIQAVPEQNATLDSNDRKESETIKLKFPSTYKDRSDIRNISLSLDHVYYQAWNGEPVLISPFYLRILMHEYDNKPDKLPLIIDIIDPKYHKKAVKTADKIIKTAENIITNSKQRIQLANPLDYRNLPPFKPPIPFIENKKFHYHNESLTVSDNTRKYNRLSKFFPLGLDMNIIEFDIISNFGSRKGGNYDFNGFVSWETVSHFEKDLRRIKENRQKEAKRQKRDEHWIDHKAKIAGKKHEQDIKSRSWLVSSNDCNIGQAPGLEEGYAYSLFVSEAIRDVERRTKKKISDSELAVILSKEEDRKREVEEKKRIKEEEEQKERERVIEEKRRAIEEQKRLEEDMRKNKASRLKIGLSIGGGGNNLKQPKDAWDFDDDVSQMNLSNSSSPQLNHQGKTHFAPTKQQKNKGMKVLNLGTGGGNLSELTSKPENSNSSSNLLDPAAHSTGFTTSILTSGNKAASSSSTSFSTWGPSSLSTIATKDKNGEETIVVTNMTAAEKLKMQKKKELELQKEEEKKANYFPSLGETIKKTGLQPLGAPNGGKKKGSGGAISQLLEKEDTVAGNGEANSGSGEAASSSNDNPNIAPVVVQDIDLEESPKRLSLEEEFAKKLSMEKENRANADKGQPGKKKKPKPIKLQLFG